MATSLPSLRALAVASAKRLGKNPGFAALRLWSSTARDSIYPAVHAEDEPEAVTGQRGSSSTGKLEETIGFVGAGQMAEAMMRGFRGAGITDMSRMRAYNPGTVRMAVMRELGVATFPSSAALVEDSDIVLMCVKPANVTEVLEEMGHALGPRHLLVSIAAGVTISAMESTLARIASERADGVPFLQHRVVRVMPNTPCLVREAASAFSLGTHATEGDAHRVMMLLSSVGVALQVDEWMLDAVTGLSGSGPAFVFLAIQAMADGGVAAGLPRDVSLRLAAQTFLGAARMVAEGGDGGQLAHPGMLSDSVASPAGTTIAGLRVLERAGVRGAFMDAVIAAAERSAELSGPEEEEA